MPVGSIGIPGGGIIRSLRAFRRRRKRGLIYPIPLPPSAHNGGGTFGFSCDCACETGCGLCTVMPAIWNLNVAGVTVNNDSLCPLWNGTYQLQYSTFYGSASYGTGSCAWGFTYNPWDYWQCTCFNGSIFIHESPEIVLVYVTSTNTLTSLYGGTWPAGLYLGFVGCNPWDPDFGRETNCSYTQDVFGIEMYFLAEASINCTGSNTLSATANVWNGQPGQPKFTTNCHWPATMTVVPA